MKSVINALKFRTVVVLWKDAYWTFPFADHTPMGLLCRATGTRCPWPRAMFRFPGPIRPPRTSRWWFCAGVHLRVAWCRLRTACLVRLFMCMRWGKGEGEVSSCDGLGAGSCMWCVCVCVCVCVCSFSVASQPPQNTWRVQTHLSPAYTCLMDVALLATVEVLQGSW